MFGAVALLLASGYLVENVLAENMATRIFNESRNPPDRHVTGETVSIVIPTYKEQDYIEDTLIAIKNQTYGPIEIVVSDASDDESAEATQAVTDRYGARFVHTYVKNISLGRNLGAEIITSPMVMFLDADSIMCNDFTERLVNALNRKGCHLSHGVDLYMPREYVEKEDQQNAYYYMAAGRMIWTGIKPNTYTTGRGVLMKTDEFWDIGAYNETIDPMKPNQREDKDLGRRVAEKWGSNSLIIDRQAIVVEWPRRPNSTPGQPAWIDHAWRKGQALEGLKVG